jgi:hypothetical protein
MVDRIRQLIDFTGLSVSQFADGIEVPRAILSHILGGRNKPSLDVILKVIANYRNVNPDWLLLGVGDMLIKVAPIVIPTDNQTITETTVADNPDNYTFEVEDTAKIQNSKPATQPEVTPDVLGKQVKQIVFFYTDNTFSVFDPGV